MKRSSPHLFFAAVCLAVLPVIPRAVALPPADAVRDEEARLEAALLEQTARIRSLYTKDLVRVGRWAARRGLQKEAGDLLDRLRAVDPGYKGLAALDKAVSEPGEIEADEKEKLERTLARQLEKADTRHAQRLFAFAKKCMAVGLFTRAYDLITAVLDVDENHRMARRILGYTWLPREKQWVTDWEAGMRKRHFITAEGWIPKKWKRKWEAGQRNYKGSWVSVEEERRIRTRNEYNPFRVESEHFEVLSNLGREEAWRYAQILEDFHRQFFRVFIGYYDQVAGVRLLFNQAPTDKKHKVVLFPSRVAYLTHVKAEKGNDRLLRESAGFYSSGDRLSRFYWAEDLDSTLNTMYHEITHQLLAETKSTQPGGSRGNNWIVEGVAVYAETWEHVDGKWVPGRKVDIPEMRAARTFVESATGFSLADFVRLDHERFHKGSRGLNYALAGALAHFLMHFDGEIYKEDFVRLLAEYYAGKVREDSLVEILALPDELGTAERYALLTEQFVEYLRALEPAAGPGDSSLDGAVGPPSADAPVDAG